MMKADLLRWNSVIAKREKPFDEKKWKIFTRSGTKFWISPGLRCDRTLARSVPECYYCIHDAKDVPLEFFLHVPFDAYECQEMQYHELMCFLAPVEGNNALLVTPTVLEEPETLVTYYFPQHFNMRFGLPKGSRIHAGRYRSARRRCVVNCGGQGGPVLPLAPPPVLPSARASSPPSGRRCACGMSSQVQRMQFE